MSTFRSSADILIDAGSSAEIINPKSDAVLIIAATDQNSVIRYVGQPLPSATTRIQRGSVFEFNDGTTSRVLTGGATAGTYGGGTWAGTAGTNTITGPAGHSLRIGDHVQIPGAGTAGATLHAYIVDMSATSLVATLDRNIVTTVVAAAMVNGAREVSSGTYTPNVTGATIAGAATYSTTPTGDWFIDEYGYCTINVNAAWTAHTGTGTMLITLPFMAAVSAVCPMFPVNFTYGATTPYIVVSPNLPYCQGRTMTDGGAGANLVLDTAASIVFTLRYKPALLA